MIQKEWTVSQLINYLKNRLDSDSFIQSIWVLGEISNFTAHNSGHFYFTLKDSGSRISCVMFANFALRIDFKPVEGQKVLIQANTSIYEKSGQIQLYVTTMIDYGKGLLYQRFLALKEKLGEAGFFNDDHKKDIPKYPFKIAIVTGKDTAARQDVLTTIKRRWPIAIINEFPCLVQGDEAYLSIIKALAQADQIEADVILLVRGGGSIEDLWAFNEEILVKYIYELKTPIITGVGHETDTTLADYVSDKRAPTPTGAAELATPVLYDIVNEIDDAKRSLLMIIERILKNRNDQLFVVKNSQLILNPQTIIQRSSMNLMMMIKALDYQINDRKKLRIILDNQINIFDKTKNQLILNRQHQLELSKRYLKDKIESEVLRHKQMFSHDLDLLNAYSPLNIIKKGYAIINKDDLVIKSIEQVNIDDKLTIRLSDGVVKVNVNDKESN